MLLAAMLAGSGSWAPAAPVEFGNERLQLRFNAPERGMGLLGVEDCAAKESFFVPAEPEKALLWQLEVTPPGEARVAAVVNNLTPASCSVERDGGTLRLKWEHIALDDVPDALDVTVDAAFDPSGRAVLTIRPELHSDAYTFNCLIFPAVRNAVRPAEQQRLLFPRGTLGSRLTVEPLQGVYPSCESQLQFFGVFGRTGGLYLGLHDGTAARKFFQLDEARSLWIWNYGINTTLPGQSSFPAYPVVLAPARSPWECCGIYRDWATEQVWARRGKWCDRTLPPGADNIALWLNLDGPPEPISRNFIAEAGRQERPLAVHWYNWNIYHFDQHYPDFFPPQPGFREAVEAMQRDGDFVVPYINGRLWDTALENYRQEGEPGAAKHADGTVQLEDYGSGTVLAAMCPTSEAYRRKIGRAVKTLVEEYGVKGVYVDQVAAAAPVLCYDAAHGHPLGGGGWWQQAYRAMFQPLAEQYEGKVYFATENGAEPYLDSFDAFLLWMAVWDNDFPSLPAVYGQYARYFCSPAEPEDDLPSFAALLSRCLLWDIQPGWLRWLHGTGREPDGEIRRRRDYVDRVVALRALAAEVLRDGVLVDEVRFVEPPEEIEVVFHRNGDYCRPPTPGRFASHYGTVRVAGDRQALLAAIAEISGTATETSFVLDPVRYGAAFAGRTVFRLFEDGRREAVGKAGEPIEVKLQPFDLQLYWLE